jgi:hypothetical protein
MFGPIKVIGLDFAETCVEFCDVEYMLAVAKMLGAPLTGKEAKIVAHIEAPTPTDLAGILRSNSQY